MEVHLLAKLQQRSTLSSSFHRDGVRCHFAPIVHAGNSTKPCAKAITVTTFCTQHSHPIPNPRRSASDLDVPGHQKYSTRVCNCSFPKTCPRRSRKATWQGACVPETWRGVSFRGRLIFQGCVYRAIVNCKIYQDQRGRHNSGGCYPGGMKHGGQTRHKYPVAEQSRSREQAQTRCGVATSSISNNLLSRDYRILEIRTRTQL